MALSDDETQTCLTNILIISFRLDTSFMSPICIAPEVI